MIALAGAIVLLIVGAQILNWYWLVVLFAAGLAAGAYRLRASLLKPYEIAQSIDRRLALKDALSGTGIEIAAGLVRGHTAQPIVAAEFDDGGFRVQGQDGAQIGHCVL